MKLTRQQLYDMFWEKGTGTLQKELGLTYTELKKLAEKHNIPRPTSAYWSALNYGKDVEKTPFPASTDGMIDEIETDNYKSSRKSCKVEVAKKEKKTTDNVSSVKELEDECVKSNNIFTVPEILYAKDLIIFDTIAKHRERVYESENGWQAKNPFKCKAENYLEINVSKEVFDRAIRIFYTIIKAARSLGYDIETKHKKGQYDRYEGGTFFVVKNERISVEINECNRQVINNEGSYSRRELVPSGDLRFRIHGRYSFQNKEIKDTKCTKLEDKIEDIIHALEREADDRIEEERRRKIAEEERRLEEERKRKEKEERERREALRKEEREKVLSLLIDVERHSVASRMNEYIEAYKRALNERGIAITDELQKDIDWMQQKADWMNPFVNRQDEILEDADFHKILHPKEKTTNNSYRSWDEPREKEYDFWQRRNMFRKKL